ncbi:MAG: DNA polymerase, partial [Fidelibacterota bacterium]
MAASRKKRLFLIDGYAIVYRAHFAMIRNPLLTSDGRHTSALFGFVNSVFKLLRDEAPDYLAAVFDGKEKTFRHEIFPEYKATREKMPDELRQQLSDLWKLVDAMNIPRLEVEGYEADDVIGSLAVRAKQADLEAYIVSGDKDFMQLVNDSTFVYSPGRQNAPTTVFDRDQVMDKWGVWPEQMIDLLALMGDASDNVPGVHGVGKKTATQLLHEYGTFDDVLHHAPDVRNKRVRASLTDDVDNARLSKELVTIRTDVPLDLSVDELRRRSFDFEALDSLFRDLEFYALQNQLHAFSQKESSEEPGIHNGKTYVCVTAPGELHTVLRALLSAGLVSLDIESTSTDPMQAEIVGLSFSVTPDEGWYIPILFPEKKKDQFTEEGGDLQAVLEAIRPVLEDESIPKTGQNIKYDLLILKNHEIDVKGVVFDTMVAAHLLRPEVRSYKLDYLSQEYLHYRTQPITDLIGMGKDQISMTQVPVDRVTHYAAEDADVALQLTAVLEKELEDEHLLEFMNRVEIPLIPVLVRMEQNGVYVHREMMAEMSNWMEKKLDVFRREIHALAGTEFNVNSSQQLAVILFDKLNLPHSRKRSTDVNVLESLRNEHPLPGKVLEYRKFQKLKSTYVDAIPKLLNPKTGRIHSSFSQTATATGRLSSSNPNFQNIPI